MTKAQHLFLWIAAHNRREPVNATKHRNSYIDDEIVDVMSRELLRILTEHKPEGL